MKLSNPSGRNASRGSIRSPRGATNLVVVLFMMLLLVQIIFGIILLKKCRLVGYIPKSLLIITLLFFVTDFISPAFIIIGIIKPIYALTASIGSSTAPKATRYSPSPTPDPTVNWKTYTDTKNVFSIRYPPSWNQIMSADKVVITPYTTATFTGQGVLIDVFENINRLLAKDYVVQNIIPQSNYTKNGKITTQLSSVDGVVVEGVVNPVSGDQSGPTAYITNGSKVVTLELSYLQNRRTFDQMLSAFKFTDQNTTCQTDSDCQKGYSCDVIGPLVKDAPVKKECTPPEVAVPH